MLSAQSSKAFSINYDLEVSHNIHLKTLLARVCLFDYTMELKLIV